jgi:hypothetical protein
MNIQRKVILHREKIVFWSLFILLTLPLVFHFNWPFARDSAVYVSGFESLIAGTDPYENGIFRSGLFGSFFFFLIALAIPASLESVTFLCLNIFGVVCFVRYFLDFKYRKTDFYILLLVSWSSASREGLNTIQIAGILLGLISIVLRSVDKIQVRPINFLDFYLGVLCTAILVDLKPHYVLPLLIIVFVKRRSFRFASTVIAVLVAGHAIIDLWVGKFLTFTWLKLMMSLADEPIDEERKDFANVWSIVFSTFDLGSFAKLLPYIFIAITALVTAFAKTISFEKSIFIGSSLPLLSTYTHYYDYLGIVVMCIVAVAIHGKSKDLLIITPLLLIAENWQNPQGFLLILFFLLLCFFSVYEWKVLAQITAFLRDLVLSLSLYLIVHMGQDFFVEQGVNYMALSATSTLLFLYFYYWRCISNSVHKI